MLLLFKLHGNPPAQHSDATKHLPEPVVQILTYPVALMLAYAHHFLLESALFGHIPENTGKLPLSVCIIFTYRQINRKLGSVFSLSGYLTPDSYNLLLTGLLVISDIAVVLLFLWLRHENMYILAHHFAV